MVESVPCLCRPIVGGADGSHRGSRLEAGGESSRTPNVVEVWCLFIIYDSVGLS